MSNGPIAPLRLASLTQFPIRNREAYNHGRTHKHDVAPGRDARQWFALLQPVVHATRPVIKEAHEVAYPTTKRVQVTNKKTGRKTWKRVPAKQYVQRPAVLGRPTFQNIIDEKGAHV